MCSSDLHVNLLGLVACEAALRHGGPWRRALLDYLRGNAARVADFVAGQPRLAAAPVEATDIRAGAGLVLAGLVAEGTTTVYGVSHIDRGYAGFVPALTGLGAQVERVSEP